MAVSKQQDVKRLYDSSADAYSGMMDEEIDLPLYEEALSRFVEQMAPIDGPVLDTSCGSGHMLAKLADTLQGARSLIGVDLSPRMVAIAHDRLGDRAQILEGDMTSLPEVIGEATCAGIISFFALHHIASEQLDACFAEWARVLRPGGRITLAAWEGQGTIDYGAASDVVANRYSESQIVEALERSELRVTGSRVAAVEGMEMDAVYVDAARAD